MSGLIHARNEHVGSRSPSRASASNNAGGNGAGVGGGASGKAPLLQVNPSSCDFVDVEAGVIYEVSIQGCTNAHPCIHEQENTHLYACDGHTLVCVV